MTTLMIGIKSFMTNDCFNVDCDARNIWYRNNNYFAIVYVGGH